MDRSQSLRPQTDYLSLRTSIAARSSVRNSTCAAVEIENRGRRRAVQPAARLRPDSRSAFRRASSSPAGACGRGSRSRAPITDRFCTSPMSCTSRMRRPPISKLCGDSNSSAPNADCARETSPCVSPSFVPNTPASDTCASSNGLERERRAVVAGVEHHADARRLHLLHQLGDRRQPVVRVRDQSDAHQRLPPRPPSIPARRSRGARDRRTARAR